MNKLIHLQEKIANVIKHVESAVGNKKEYYEILKVIWSKEEEYVVISFPKCYAMDAHPTDAFESYLQEQGYSNLKSGDEYLVIPFDPKKNDMYHIMIMFNGVVPHNLKSHEPIELYQLQDMLRYSVISEARRESVWGRALMLKGTPLMTKLWAHGGYNRDMMDYYHNTTPIPTFAWLSEDQANVKVKCDKEGMSFEVIWKDTDGGSIEVIGNDGAAAEKFRNYIASLTMNHMSALNSYGEFIELARNSKSSTLNNPVYDNSGRLNYIFEKIADTTRRGTTNPAYTEISMIELDELVEEYRRLRKLLA